MVSTLTWVALGIGLYWIALVFLRDRGLLPEYVGVQGPLITLHTKRFREFLDRMAAPKRAWRAWGNFGVGVALVVMFGSFLFFGFAALSTLRNPPAPSAVNQPRNVLVIPGVNDYLPLSVAPEIALGLAIGMVVHEGGHGLMCRVGDIDIESVGLVLLAALPIGAFVEPDEESRRQASRGDQTRMFAAGVTNNFAITLFAFLLLFGPVMGAFQVASGVAVGDVLLGSAAADADLGKGDRILGVNGQSVANESALDDRLASIEETTVRLRVDTGSRIRTVRVDRSLLVTGMSGISPFRDLVEGERTTRIVAVNGTNVTTEVGLRSALEPRRVATLRTANGTTATGPIGAAVQVMSDGPAEAAGLPAGESVVVTSIAGNRIVSTADLDRVLRNASPNETVSVEYFEGGTPRSRSVTLGNQSGHGFLGVFVARGISGFTVDEFGIQTYPAGQYLRVLGGGDGGGIPFFARIVVALQLPLAGLVGSLPFNFAGFTGGVANFYTVGGPIGLLGEGAFFLANVLFWTGWINLNLGVFNCIPAFPLDGGHILRTSTEAVVSRLPVERRRALTTAVTTAVGLSMLAALVLTLFGPRLL